MNEYVRAGILADLRAGRRVLVLSSDLNTARRLITEVGSHTGEGEVMVRRTNGEERIHALDGPGSIYFKSVLSRLDGFTADVVVFDGYLPSRELLDNAKRVVASSLFAKIIRP